MESDVATIDPAGLAGGTTTGGGRTGQRSLLSRAAPLAGLVCWLYLSIVACLVVWV